MRHNCRRPAAQSAAPARGARACPSVRASPPAYSGRLLAQHAWMMAWTSSVRWRFGPLCTASAHIASYSLSRMDRSQRGRAHAELRTTSTRAACRTPPRAAGRGLHMSIYVYVCIYACVECDGMLHCGELTGEAKVQLSNRTSSWHDASITASALLLHYCCCTSYCLYTVQGTSICTPVDDILFPPPPTSRVCWYTYPYLASVFVVCFWRALLSSASTASHHQAAGHQIRKSIQDWST